MPNVQVFEIKISNLLLNIFIDERDLNLAKISIEYHEFAKIFSKKKSNKLPKHRHYDHIISLQKEIISFLESIYNLFLAKLKALYKYINIHFRKEFIHYS